MGGVGKKEGEEERVLVGRLLWWALPRRAVCTLGPDWYCCAETWLTCGR